MSELVIGWDHSDFLSLSMPVSLTEKVHLSVIHKAKNIASHFFHNLYILKQSDKSLPLKRLLRYLNIIGQHSPFVDVRLTKCVQCLSTVIIEYCFKDFLNIYFNREGKLKLV